MLEYFVSHFSEFYWDSTLGYNVHNILHLTDAARLYGTVDNFSAYRFENCIRILGKMIKKTHQELQQVNNRIQEYNNCNEKIGVKVGGDFKVGCDERNSYFLLKGGGHRFVQVVEVLELDNQLKVREFRNRRSLFTAPYDFLQFNLALCVVDPLLGQFPKSKIERREIRSKCYGVKDADVVVLIPLL